VPRILLKDPEDLKAMARTIRRDILAMTAVAGSGHYMSSLSSVEILVSLYFSVMSYDPEDPAWPGRDRFVLSKGHASPGLYAVLARAGFIPVEELATLRKIGSRLQGHPVSHLLPGLDASSGSLGQGLSTGAGMALAGRLDGAGYRVHVLLGDGELQEGQVWEAAMAASRFCLGNLTAIVDQNDLQATGRVSEIMPVKDLAGAFRAFGWNALAVDGHDFGSLLGGFRAAEASPETPTVLLARTVKGAGVDFVENNLKYHSAPLTPEELGRAMGCLE
jgi:transketolase